MKLRIIYTFFLFLFGCFLLMSHSDGRASNNNEGNTGAPNDNNSSNNRTCQNCHNSGSFVVTPELSITDSGGGAISGNYIPGEVYTVKLTVNSDGAPAGYGFQMVALNAAENVDGAPINTWAVPASSTNVQLAIPANGRQYAEQNGTSSTNEFIMEWTAPASGDVTFYYGGNAVNGNGLNSLDNAIMGSTSLSPDPTSINELEKSLSLNIFPNPVSEVMSLQTNAQDSDNYDLFIYDQNGHQILNQKINIPSGENISPIDVNNFSSGVYNLIISDGKNQIAKKILKL